MQDKRENSIKERTFFVTSEKLGSRFSQYLTNMKYFQRNSI